MSDNAFGEFFLSEGDDELTEEDELLAVPVVVPGVPQATPSSMAGAPPSAHVGGTPAVAHASHFSVPEVRPEPSIHRPSREERLAAALDALMENNQEILAAVLVSLDGFTMAAALPPEMEDDRVGAMSAAILGLGERAAAELGRGALTQVFIEGENGYVMLIAAGNRAVLTCIADIEAKLGLVLYDMRDAAETIAEILG